MPTSGNARLLSNEVLANWLLQNFPFCIQNAWTFPYTGVEGNAVRYALTDVLTPAATIGPGDPIPDNTVQPNDPNVICNIAEFADSFKKTYVELGAFDANEINQVASQMALSVWKLLYAYWRDVLWTGEGSGDSADNDNPNKFVGFPGLVQSSNIRDMKSGELKLSAVIETKRRLRGGQGNDMKICTSTKGYGDLILAHYYLGLMPHYKEMALPYSDGSIRTVNVLTVDGSEVYINDFVRVRECKRNEPGEPIPPEMVLKLDPGKKVVTEMWFYVEGENNVHGIFPEKRQDDPIWKIGAQLPEGIPGLTPEMMRMITVRKTTVPGGSTEEYHLTMSAGVCAVGDSLALLTNFGTPTR